ncbi:AAA family ATPase [bacterium]|nr:AAA family ATPase [bacterium]
MPPKEPPLIGLTGTNGSGKGEAAAFFIKNGFTYYSLSDLIRDELRKNGKPVTRNNLIRKGNSLREKYGPDILARKIMEKVQGKSVIDSIRNPQEVKYLKKQKNFTLLAVDAPPYVRYKRVQNRGRDESASSFQEFLQKEKQEMGPQKRAQRLQECIKRADHLIINDGSLEDLYHKLEKFL